MKKKEKQNGRWALVGKTKVWVPNCPKRLVGFSKYELGLLSTHMGWGVNQIKLMLKKDPKNQSHKRELKALRYMWAEINQAEHAAHKWVMTKASFKNIQ